MRSLLTSILFFAVACAALPALADTQKGIDTQGDPLPIGAGGTSIMFVRPAGETNGEASGGITIGRDTPAAAKLDVYGGVRIGQDDEAPPSSGGSACSSSKEGTISQSQSADGALFVCAYNSATSAYIWKTLGKSGSVYGLQDMVMQPYGGWIMSNTLQYNADSSATVSVTSNGFPAYLRINGGAWVQSATVSKNQTVQLGVTAPYANLASVTVTLTTGSETDTWTITTAPHTYVNLNYTDSYGYQSITCFLGTGCSKSMYSTNLTEYNCNDHYTWYVSTSDNNPNYSCSMYNRCGTGGTRDCGPYVSN